MAMEFGELKSAVSNARGIGEQMQAWLDGRQKAAYPDDRRFLFLAAQASSLAADAAKTKTLGSVSVQSLVDSADLFGLPEEWKDYVVDLSLRTGAMPFLVPSNISGFSGRALEDACAQLGKAAIYAAKAGRFNSRALAGLLDWAMEGYAQSARALADPVESAPDVGQVCRVQVWARHLGDLCWIGGFREGGLAMDAAPELARVALAALENAALYRGYDLWAENSAPLVKMLDNGLRVALEKAVLSGVKAGRAKPAPSM